MGSKNHGFVLIKTSDSHRHLTSLVAVFVYNLFWDHCWLFVETQTKLQMMNLKSTPGSEKWIGLLCKILNHQANHLCAFHMRCRHVISMFVYPALNFLMPSPLREEN